MRNARVKYMCFPSVVCVGKPITVTLTPRDTSRIFRPEKEYELCVLGMEDDLADRRVPIPMDVPCVITEGCLQFTFTFPREQEYSVRFREKGSAEKPIRVPMYAVEEDLYALRPLKGDLHSHSYYSDGQDGIAMTAANYREEGFDFFALTDHNRMFPSVLQKEVYRDVKTDICMLRGEEIHTPGSEMHIVHLGGNFSVCERYVKEPEAFLAEVAEIEKEMGYIPEQYRLRVAKAKWACQQIKKAGGMSVFAHPFWASNLYNVSRDFRNYLFDEKIFDAFELLNAADTAVDNLQVAVWQEQIAKGNILPITVGSDSHNHDFATGEFGRIFSIVFAKENTEQAILQAIRDGYSVAAELPRSDDNDLRVYGREYRLIAFARFLWHTYFNDTWRLCIGEGILMRRWAQGEDVSVALNALSGSVEDFYNRFYGLAPAPRLSARVQAYLATLRQAQIDCGINTIGSVLDSPKPRRE